MITCKMAGQVLPAAFALALLAAPFAVAQSTTATPSTMAPSPMAPSTMAPTTSTMAPATSTMAPKTTTVTMPPVSTSSANAKSTTPSNSAMGKSHRFATVAAATAHCPGDAIVWSSGSKSKSYHLSTSKFYGKTKHGFYACKQEADSSGYHAAKT